MFGITEDLEISNQKTTQGIRTRKRARQIEKSSNRKWYETKSALESEEEEDSSDALFNLGDLCLGQVKDIDPEDKCSILTSPGVDYTKRPRFSEEEVEVDMQENALFVSDDVRSWDPFQDAVEVSSIQWAMGGGNSTEHVVPPFVGDMGVVPFVRLLKELNPAKYAEAKRQQEILEKEQKEKESKSKVMLNGPIKLEEDAEAVTDGEATIKSEPDANDHEEKGDESIPNVQQPPTTDDEAATGTSSSSSSSSSTTVPGAPENEDIVDRIKRLTGIVLRDPEMARQRFKEESLEDECYMRDEPSLHLVTDAQDSIGRRAVCVSTILRNLSFVPGNEFEFSRSAAFLRIAGRLLLLYHWYPARTPKQRNYDRGVEEEDTGESCSSLTGDSEWWWDYLHVIRENVMVILANIAGSLEFRHFDEDVVKPILHGLLEWSVSSSSYAQDPFPYVGPHSPVSPQRLAIETLCKICLYDHNVDLILSTPPFSRLVKLTRMLAKKLYRYEDQVLREFSINMLYYFSAADSGVARVIALADNTVGLMLGFIEQAEQNAMVVAQQHGVNALRDNPDSMGTSLDMLRRAASTLNNLSRHKDNVSLFVKHEERLLSLVMSQILDQGVAAILSHVLFNIGSDQDRCPPASAFVSQPSPGDTSTSTTTNGEAAKTDAITTKIIKEEEESSSSANGSENGDKAVAAVVAADS